MNGEIKNKLQRGIALTVKESWDLYKYIEALEQEPCEDKGEISDGYHTFNQLYHQRAILFATIVNQNKDKAWKSFKHSDGRYCFDENGEWFIVGVDTPQGSYTYHYAKEYWNMFDCQELEFGKEWDGHSEEDVVRLLSLEQQPCEYRDCVSREAVLDLVADYELSMGQVVKGIHALPLVTPKADWISVDERMPEDGQKVLFCDIDNDIMIGYHVRGRENTHFSQDGSYEDIKNVRAWMPIPVKPYFEDIKSMDGVIRLSEKPSAESEE